jgi:HK97 family phage major capsid protein
MSELKFLTEQRAEKLEEMNKILSCAKTEKRAMTEEQLAAFEVLKQAVEAIDGTIEAEEKMREKNLNTEETEVKEVAASEEKRAENVKNTEVRAFVDYIRNPIQNRANFTVGDNGALVPVTISKMIIEAIADICPIYNMAQMFNVKGELRIPYYGDNSGDNITCGYAAEFTDLTAHAGKFTATTLNGYTAGVLTLISKSLIGKASEAGFNVVGYITKEIAKKVSQFIEHEYILGSGTSACQGILVGATNLITSSTIGAVKADDLIDLQESIPDVYQKDAVWVMNRATRAVIRKFKDGNGQYLLNQDLTAKWGYTLLGKPVYTSDNMPTVAGGNKAIIYGDMTGLTAKVAQPLEIQVLNERYATMHAVGICGWLEVDSKVTDQQKLAVLKILASS